MYDCTEKRRHLYPLLVRHAEPQELCDQEREVREALKKLEIDPSDALVIHDEAESGTKTFRDEFARLTDMVERNEIGILAVDDQARFTRADNAFAFITDLVFSGAPIVATVRRLAMTTTVPAAKAEKAILDFLDDILLSWPEWVAKALAEMRRVIQETATRIPAEIAADEKRLAQSEKQIENWADPLAEVPSKTIASRLAAAEVDAEACEADRARPPDAGRAGGDAGRCVDRAQLQDLAALIRQDERRAAILQRPAYVAWKRYVEAQKDGSAASRRRIRPKATAASPPRLRSLPDLIVRSFPEICDDNSRSSASARNR